jgi:hypothetical protein
MLSRNRRASISRPYFHHWRQSRDNNRYISKNLLAFSPRLGRRVNDGSIKRRAIVEEENNSSDIDLFLLTLAGYLQEKKINIIYEDSNKICLSNAINDDLFKEILDKFDANRRQQEEQETNEQNFKNKHPFIFRYRFG